MADVSLAGIWQVTWCDGLHGKPEHFQVPIDDPGRYLACPFPGSIQAGLVAAGLLDDPRLSINALKARWVQEHYWIVRTTCQVPEAAVDQAPCLRIGVLDGVAKVAVNGILVGEHANSNHPARFELGDALKPGENEIAILLESGVFRVADLCGSDYDTRQLALNNKRPYLRQAQYQFGWDWNPDLVFIGLHGDLLIEWGTTPRLEQVLVQTEVSDDLASAKVRLLAGFEVPGAEPVDIILRGAFDGRPAVERPATIGPGSAEADVTLELDDVSLWWPRGYGEAHMYGVELTALHGGVEVARWSGRVGLRRVSIAQPPHPDGGRYFQLQVNGETIFCKGANWAPSELSGHEAGEQSVRRLIELAVEQHFNVLRINGVGVWAGHHLLDLCDQHGILVWHDLLFGCSKYPADQPAFLADVEREIAWGIREFSRHPSLAVWCGNNEMEWGMWDWGYTSSGRSAPDYMLFHHVVPGLVARLDPQRPYWPSSPYSGDNEHPNDPLRGDQHPWGVSLGADGPNFWAYREYVDHYPTEGGVLGASPLASLRQALSAAELVPRSLAWEHHDNAMQFARATPGLCYEMVKYWLGRPIGDMRLEEYVLASGLLQAEGLKEYALNYRRRWPSTTAAMFWSYNDSWPVVHGWTTVDYYLRKKPAFYAIRRAYAPLAVALVDEGDQLAVYAINDTAAQVVGSIETGHFAARGARIEHNTDRCTLAPRSSSRIAALPRDADHIGYAVLRDEAGLLLAQDRMLLKRFHEWNVQQAHIRVGTVERPDGRYARYESDDWVWSVVLDLSGEGSAADDVFDLLPGIPYDVPLDAPEALPVQATGNQLLLGTPRLIS